MCTLMCIIWDILWNESRNTSTLLLNVIMLPRGLSDHAVLGQIISLMLVNKGVMGESVRKRRSMWDTEENFSRHELNAKNAWVGKCDYPSHDGRSYQEQVSSKTDNSSKRHSGWNHSPQNSLLQTSQRISKDVERLPETEEHKREKFYHENMSPTFDGRRQLRNSQFPEHGLSQSRRSATVFSYDASFRLITYKQCYDFTYKCLFLFYLYLNIHSGIISVENI